MKHKFAKITDVPKDFTGCCWVDWVEQLRFYRNGVLHRLDGPAISHFMFASYYIHGIQHDQKDYEREPLVTERRLLTIMEYDET